MRADIHDGPEQNSSKQRPDTLLQDRSYQIDETSCNARPDQCSEASCHSSGWKSRQQRCYGASGEDNGTIVALANQWSALCHG